MPRRPAAYPAAYREQIIALARAGRTSKELAKEFEPSEQTIRNWLFQAEADRGERPGALTSEERAELQRLRRENRQLKVERGLESPTRMPCWDGFKPFPPAVERAKAHARRRPLPPRDRDDAEPPSPEAADAIHLSTPFRVGVTPGRGHRKSRVSRACHWSARRGSVASHTGGGADCFAWGMHRQPGCAWLADDARYRALLNQHGYLGCSIGSRPGAAAGAGIAPPPATPSSAAHRTRPSLGRAWQAAARVRALGR